MEFKQDGPGRVLLPALAGPAASAGLLVFVVKFARGLERPALALALASFGLLVIVIGILNSLLLEGNDLHEASRARRQKRQQQQAAFHHQQQQQGVEGVQDAAREAPQTDEGDDDR